MNINKLTLKQQLIAGFSLPIAAILLIAFVVYLNITNMMNANKWVDHTHNVINAGDRLMSSMIDMETGMRGFLVSGNENYLEPYTEGQAHFDNDIAALQQTVSDNPSQVARLKQIEKMKQNWMEQAAEPQIHLRREVNLSQAAVKEFEEISSRIVGKQKFDALRAELASIEKALVAQNDLEARYLLQQILTAMINQETGQRGFLLSGQEISLEPFFVGQDAFEAQLIALRDHLSKVNYSTADIRSKLVQVETLVAEWRAIAAQPEIEARRDMNKVTTQMSDISQFIEKGVGKNFMDAIRLEIETFIETEQKLIALRSAEAEQTADSTVIMLIASAIVGVGLAIGAGVLIVRNTYGLVGAEPAYLAEVSRQVASGDLSRDLHDQDKTSGIYSAMVEMTTNLKSLLRSVADSGQAQVSSTERLSATAEQALANASLQNSATDQVAAAIHEMSATAQEVALSSSRASDSANQARLLVDEGSDKISLITKDINQLSLDLNSTSEVIEDLSSSAASISNILDVIRNIADRTNLLALNAAIEAARAGEQGRGFAVVADEVRSLAQNTQNSTQEIENMIQKVQQGAANSSQAMQSGREKVSQLVIQSEDVNSAFTQIMASVVRITDMSSQIATAAEQQQYTTEDITKRVVEIRDLSNQSEQGSLEINASIQDMARLTQSMNYQVGKFAF